MGESPTRQSAPKAIDGAGKVEGERRSRDCRKKSGCKKKEFVTLDGLRFEKTPHGLIFCPEYDPTHRKHTCPDCMTCAWCSDPRCAVCRESEE